MRPRRWTSLTSTGILHRDIKPSNLMLDDEGTLWVTDFGLARIEGDPGLTMSGDLLGTLRYMSPEQVLGKRVFIDERTDVYSLGVTLYEMLTLRPAFEGSDRAELLRKISFEEPIAPRRLDPSIPPDLETIVLSALAHDPRQRYETARETCRRPPALPRPQTDPGETPVAGHEAGEMDLKKQGALGVAGDGAASAGCGDRRRLGCHPSLSESR